MVYYIYQHPQPSPTQTHALRPPHPRPRPKMAFSATESFPSIMQRGIENPQLANTFEIKVSRTGIFYLNNKSLNNWYSAVVGSKRAYGTVTRSMTNYGMMAKKMPNGSWFRRFPTEDFSLWKNRNSKMKAQGLSPHLMMLIDAACMQLEEVSVQLEAASVQPEAASVQPVKVFLKFNLPKVGEQKVSEEEEMVYEEDEDYSVGI